MFMIIIHLKFYYSSILTSGASKVRQAHENVQVGKDQEKAQSENDSHSKNRDGKKTKLTIKYLYHENILAANFPIGGHSVT